MLYHLLYPLRESFGGFNVFGYISFRAAAAMATALLLAMVLYPPFIRFLTARKLGQSIREIGPDHEHKAGTPTMGGLLIFTSVLLATLIWTRLDSPKVWMVLAVAAGFCVVGFFDDWGKINTGTHLGLSGKMRLFLEFVISGAVIFVAVHYFEHSTVVPIPFFKDVYPDLGWAYIPFAAFIVTGAANAVNLTDGLDGLAIGPVMTAALTFGLLAYVVGSEAYARQLALLHVPGVAELAVLTVTLAGAGMGFLWFNTYPATIFMGDTGSLPLGGILGMLAVLTHSELLLALIGGVFVAETLSVIIQVVSFKTTGKRVFLMAPIHHHYEKKWDGEPKVIVRFWIISIILALLAVMTLKLR